VVLLGCILAGVTLCQGVACLEGPCGYKEALCCHEIYELDALESATKAENFTFTCIPLEYDAYYEIIPLGNINPPCHTFPTDHVYFVLNDDVHSVRAPGNGVITRVRNCTFN